MALKQVNSGYRCIIPKYAQSSHPSGCLFSQAWALFDLFQTLDAAKTKLDSRIPSLARLDVSLLAFAKTLQRRMRKSGIQEGAVGAQP
jgi:hypothetical protein